MTFVRKNRPNRNIGIRTVYDQVFSSHNYHRSRVSGCVCGGVYLQYRSQGHVWGIQTYKRQRSPDLTFRKSETWPYSSLLVVLLLWSLHWVSVWRFTSRCIICRKPFCDCVLEHLLVYTFTTLEQAFPFFNRAVYSQESGITYQDIIVIEYTAML